MAKLTVKVGSTSRIEHVFILDSTSTTGAGKTGLTNASVTMYYWKPGYTAVSTPTAQTGTMSAGTLGTWSSFGFKEVDATNLPGLYEVGMPDIIFSTNVNHAVAMIKGTGIAPVVLEYDIVQYDPLDSVRLGLTALPNATHSTAGGLITSGSGTAQLTTTSGVVTANTTQWGGTNVTGMPMPTYTQPSGFLAATFPGTIASTTNITAGTIATVTNAVTVGTINANVITATSIADSALVIGSAAGTGVKAYLNDTTATQAIATKVWSENVASGYNTVGTAGNIVHALSGYNSTTTNNITATTTTFSVNSTASTDTYNNQTIVFVGGLLDGVSSNILTWTKNTGYCTVVVEDALPSAPNNNSNFYILPTHVQSVKDIRVGIWNQARATASSSGGVPAAGTYGYYLDQQVSTVGSGSAPTVAQIWQTDVSGFSTAGQAGTYLKNAMAASTYTAPPTLAQIWQYDISGISVPGQAGRYITDINVDTSNISSSTSTIESVAYRQSIADYLLGRNIAGGSDGGRTVKDALRVLRNKVSISGTTLTVKAEDDVTTAWTATLTTDAAATPVTGIDPAGP